MSWKCDIVTDLAPLYHDGLASVSSKKVVREHLKECPECRDYYKKYRPVENVAVDTPFSAGGEDFVLLAKQMRRRRLLLWMGFLSYVGATMGVWLLHRLHKDKF